KFATTMLLPALRPARPSELPLSNCLPLPISASLFLVVTLGRRDAADVLRIGAVRCAAAVIPIDLRVVADPIWVQRRSTGIPDALRARRGAAMIAIRQARKFAWHFFHVRFLNRHRQMSVREPGYGAKLARAIAARSGCRLRRGPYAATPPRHGRE